MFEVVWIFKEEIALQVQVIDLLRPSLMNSFPVEKEQNQAEGK